MAGTKITPNATIAASLFINKGAADAVPANDEGRVPILETDGKLGREFLRTAFGGDGRDGALTVTGTTNIDLGGKKMFVKNYTSISITGTGKITFSNPHVGGTVIVFKCTGDVVITSTASPAIDLRNIGSSVSTQPNGLYFGNTANVFGQTAVTVTYGIGGLPPAPDVYFRSNDQFISVGRPFVVCGAGGGNGGQGTIGTPGNGSRGGGALYIECAGALNFTGTINSSGTDGIGAVDGGAGGRGSGGGGGGSAGMVVIVYNTLTANTGTITATGGAGGRGSDGTAASGNTGRGGGGGASVLFAGGDGGNSNGGSGPTGVTGLGVGAGSGGGSGSASATDSTGGLATASMGGWVIQNEYF